MALKNWGIDNNPTYNSLATRDWGGYTPPVLGFDQISQQNVGGNPFEVAPQFGVGQSAGQGSWWDSLFDRTDMKTGMKSQGMAAPMIQGASALMSGILGWKQFGLQKDALKQTKKEFDMNWGAQQKSVNSSLEDRQRARVASNPGAYQSVGEYMDKNRI